MYVRHVIEIVLIVPFPFDAMDDMMVFVGGGGGYFVLDCTRLRQQSNFQAMLFVPVKW